MPRGQQAMPQPDDPWARNWSDFSLTGCCAHQVEISPVSSTEMEMDGGKTVDDCLNSSSPEPGGSVNCFSSSL
ncbi:hypothetical protein Y1Q_0000628 [Alligator mississippiensis]|uniref:Uncharacterized protein n=1 Tax=Alligator mississippiensis TaxID=8496 RepID=A0A151MBU0_ALLMI|nr:hypothetical protein Y1Q_0000628 [Alligator mississippiensis]